MAENVNKIRDNLQISSRTSHRFIHFGRPRPHVSARVAELVKRHINSKLEIIRNSGHVCNLDQPEVFNERSIRFIKAIAGNSEPELSLL
jgi:pimeloyl-ACP methyl ester carboxylesterase